MRRKSNYRATVTMLLMCIMINPMVLEARGYAAGSLPDDLSLIELIIIILVMEVVYCISYFIKYIKGECKSVTFVKHFVAVDILALILLIHYYLKVL